MRRRAGPLSLLTISLAGCAGDLGESPEPADFDTLEAPIIV